MAISAVVIHLTAEIQKRRAALRCLRADPRILLGDVVLTRLPAVIDTDSPEHDLDCWRWLHSVDGICAVDLVSVHYDCVEENFAHH